MVTINILRQISPCRVGLEDDRVCDGTAGSFDDFLANLEAPLYRCGIWELWVWIGSGSGVRQHLQLSCHAKYNSKLETKNVFLSVEEGLMFKTDTMSTGWKGSEKQLVVQECTSTFQISTIL
jgi:hypothetical protein